MYSKTGFSIVNCIFKLIAVSFVLSPGTTLADNLPTTLIVEPNRCIALQQGQTCYADLKFEWANPPTGQFCLFDERQPDPVVCWMGNTLVSYKLQFKSDKNVNFEIRSKPSDLSLAQVLVKVSWVYKSNTSSTSRWRLF